MKTTTDAAAIRLARFHADRRASLANQAERRGVRIVILSGTQRHLAIEPNYPEAYALDVDRCTCKRFKLWGYCDHLALLQSELGYGQSAEDVGWPDEDPTVSPIEPPMSPAPDSPKRIAIDPQPTPLSPANRPHATWRRRDTSSAHTVAMVAD